jgi:hypothetical protein
LRRADLAKAAIGAAAILVAAGCSRHDAQPLAHAVSGTYDKTTNKLLLLASDRNGNGKVDTWTDMDGARPIRSRIDVDEDGRIDRWEYYDSAGRLVKVGFSRQRRDKPDAWAYSRQDGSLERVDVSSTSDEDRIDRHEYYENGRMVRSEEDANRDGRIDTWTTYDADGGVAIAAFDEDRDGRPDRRLTYNGPELASIESAPDAEGRYTRKEPIQR